MKRILYKVQFYRGGGIKRRWYWRIRHRNGRIVADSGQGYRRRIDCVRAFTNLQIGLQSYLYKIENES